METSYKDAFTFKCDECDARYTTKYKRRIHILKTHRADKDPFACAYCKKWFTTSEQLRRHRKRHIVKKNFKCSNCLIWFLSKTAMRVHKKKTCINKNFILSQDPVDYNNSNQEQQH